MTEKKRIACFFTAGYTELNTMKTFLKKIKDDAIYRQLCPNGPKKSRDAIRNRTSIKDCQNGLTGESLIKYILEEVEKPYFIRESYDAILIEDDRDTRFIDQTTSTIDFEKWKEFKEDLQRRIVEKGMSVPVIILLAAPEIEAWFISDWENSFGWIYKDKKELNGPQNAYFSTIFYKHIKEEVLTEKYSETIEAYGYFDGKYRKLSEEIQTALDNIDFLAGCKRAIEHKPIRYSKRIQGEDMLGNIDPNNVLRYCTTFFKDAYYELQDI